VRRLLFSVFVVAAGTGTWWLFANTARFSVRRWDAKFESLVRHELTKIGVSNKAVRSSVHEVRRDNDGEWVLHRLTVAPLLPAKITELKEGLSDGGARVWTETRGGADVISVTRGGRLYQEITVSPAGPPVPVH
jgi:hypothetical protein